MADEQALIAAALGGDLEKVASALARHPSLASARDAEGVSVIARAVYLGQPHAAAAIAGFRDDLDVFEASCLGDTGRVRRLLAEDPALLEAVSPNGFRPLGYAAFFGHLELLRVLVASGAAVEAVSENPMQVRPLHSAVAHRDPLLAPRLAAALLEAGADPDVRQEGGCTPLHEAAYNGNVELIELLLEHGANPELPDDAGVTPARMARDQGHGRAASALERAAW